MKVTITHPSKKEIQFPCAFKDKYSGLVILFFSLKAGYVLEPGVSSFNPLTYSKEWIPCTESGWIPVNATVEFTH